MGDNKTERIFNFSSVRSLFRVHNPLQTEIYDFPWWDLNPFSYSRHALRYERHGCTFFEKLCPDVFILHRYPCVKKYINIFNLYVKILRICCMYVLSHTSICFLCPRFITVFEMLITESSQNQGAASKSNCVHLCLW